MTSFYCEEHAKRYTIPINTKEFLMGMVFIENMRYDFYGVSDLQLQDAKGTDITKQVMDDMIHHKSTGKYQIQQWMGIGSDDFDLFRGAHWYLTLLGYEVDVKKDLYHDTRYPDIYLNLRYHIDSNHISIDTVAGM